MILLPHPAHFEGSISHLRLRAYELASRHTHIVFGPLGWWVPFPLCESFGSVIFFCFP